MSLRLIRKLDLQNLQLITSYKTAVSGVHLPDRRRSISEQQIILHNFSAISLLRGWESL